VDRLYLNEKELAEWLHLSLPAIRRFRYEDRGPRFVKFGSSVRYSTTDVASWIAAQPTGGGR
jgi:predicted DNA-binding transcriptional regulator AlpA